jgi:hypothetical protein
MFIYLIGGGFGKPDLVFSSYTKAQEQVLKDLRSSHPCPAICGKITAKTLDYNSQEYKYKYEAEIRDVGNLRFLKVNFGSSYNGNVSLIREVLTRYTIRDDWDLVDIQLDDYEDSSPRWISFNELDSIKGHTKSYAIGEPEPVIDEELQKYFKYCAYCCYRHDERIKRF